MSTSADSSPAPLIDGFEFRRVLGAGGFSTVYLYEQLRPRREVAIKVLTAGAFSEQGQRRFEIEANLMAELSAHPYIVTIHDADITHDGRPYLVMEYYPGANLGLRARSERIGVSEVLQVGIHIAAAVESAHRLGIIHRDIKPANVLTSRYNRPGLTDFGISVSAGTGEHDEVALSVPWSPPEAFDPSTTLDARADIYSLGAFLYSLLTGRSPFEIPGGDNGPQAIAQRIVNDSPAPIGRQDVPDELERLIVQSMSKPPLLRPASALVFAQALQAVEHDLSLPPTQIDLMEAVDESDLTALVALPFAAEATRLRLTTLAPADTLIESDLMGDAQAAEATVLMADPDASLETPLIDQPSRRRWLLALVLIGIAGLLLIGLALIRASGEESEVVTPVPTVVQTPAPSITPSTVRSSAASVAPPSAPVVSQPATGNGNAKGPGKGHGKGPKRPKHR